MQFNVTNSPHSLQVSSVEWVMGQVLIALIPGTIAMIYLFGFGIFTNIILSVITTIASESWILYLRKRPIIPVLQDLSAIVTAILFAIAIPPTLPWWLTMLGSGFAIIVVKQLYGGMGYNLFNPAMAGYVFLLISYPIYMTTWLPPVMLNPHPLGFIDTLILQFTGHLPTGLELDAISAATPLEVMRTGLKMHRMISEIHCNPLWGIFGGKGWEWVGNWYAIGGLWLLHQRVITWHIPVSMLGSLIIISGCFYLLDSQCSPSPTFHIFSGGAILGAFFIATDPVTAATTPKGKIIYGSAIGLLIFIIRTWGGYPDAVAFSVLLLNTAVPIIDQLTIPRVFGINPPQDYVE
jgi:electron transport complex protein RnfD